MRYHQLGLVFIGFTAVHAFIAWPSPLSHFPTTALLVQKSTTQTPSNFYTVNLVNPGSVSPASFCLKPVGKQFAAGTDRQWLFPTPSPKPGQYAICSIKNSTNLELFIVSPSRGANLLAKFSGYMLTVSWSRDAKYICVLTFMKGPAAGDLTIIHVDSGRVVRTVRSVWSAIWSQKHYAVVVSRVATDGKRPPEWTRRFSLLPLFGLEQPLNDAQVIRHTGQPYRIGIELVESLGRWPYSDYSQVVQLSPSRQSALIFRAERVSYADFGDGLPLTEAARIVAEPQYTILRVGQRAFTVEGRSTSRLVGWNGEAPVFWYEGREIFQLSQEGPHPIRIPTLPEGHTVELLW